MKNWERSSLIRFVGGMVGYSVLLIISLLLLGRKQIDSLALAVVISLIPMLPLVMAITAVVRNVQHQDELARRIHLEAVLITALVTGGLTFSYGLLEATELVPPLSMTVVGPFMIVVWGITSHVISRRYA